VRFVFPSAILKEKDCKDFKNLWKMLNLQDSVKYCVGLSHKPVDGELALLDEVDHFVFGGP
jgi:hypothetical protein